MSRTGKLSPKEGVKFAPALARISDHLAEEFRYVRLLLRDKGRDTFSYYHIEALRPAKKDEWFLDASNHIVNRAEEAGDPHHVELILRKCRSFCGCVRVR